MMRHIVVPAAVVLGSLLGVFGFFLWDEFHMQWHPSWTVEEAYAGDITAQRHLASCYATGCSPNFASEPILACAWWETITEETKPASQQDLSALNKACSQLPTTDRSVLSSAEYDIHLRMTNQQPPTGSAGEPGA